MTMETPTPKRPSKRPRWIFDDTDALTEAMGKAVRASIRRHKALGNPIAVWRDDKVVILQPDEIVVPDDDDPMIAPDV